MIKGAATAKNVDVSVGSDARSDGRTAGQIDSPMDGRSDGGTFGRSVVVNLAFRLAIGQSGSSNVATRAVKETC